MPDISVQYDGVQELAAEITAFGAGAGQRIQGVLNDFAAAEIKGNILPLVHSSGRVFSGHRQGAKAAGPERVFTHSVKDMTLIVRTSARFGYLYFPDDGSTTRRHAGQQHFMDRGLQRSVKTITDRCLAALTDDF